MKKKVLALVMTAAMVMGLAACGGDTQTTGGAASAEAGAETTASTAAGEAESVAEAVSEAAENVEDLNVGVFYYTYSDTYITSVRTALDKALTDAGITFQNFDGNSNQTTQNEQIDTAIVQGCNLLVVNIVTSGSVDASQAIVDKASAAGIPVVFFNRAVEGDEDEGKVLGSYDKCAFVGTDAPEAGHMQGEMIGNYLVENYDTVDLNGDGKISYAMFMGQLGNVEAIYRTQYGVEDANAILTKEGKPAMQYFDSKNTTGYQVDMGGAWSASAAMEYMNTNLAQFNETNKNMIELIICNNDNMAEGCISALNAAGYNNGEGSKTIPVFGVDATDSAQTLIAEGKMTGTVKQDAEGMAAAIASTAIAVGEGKAMPEAIAAAAQKGDIYSVAEGLSNKLFVAYAPYTAENK